MPISSQKTRTVTLAADFWFLNFLDLGEVLVSSLYSYTQASPSNLKNHIISLLVGISHWCRLPSTTWFVVYWSFSCLKLINPTSNIALDHTLPSHTLSQLTMDVCSCPSLVKNSMTVLCLRSHPFDYCEHKEKFISIFGNMLSLIHISADTYMSSHLCIFESV